MDINPIGGAAISLLTGQESGPGGQSTNPGTNLFGFELSGIMRRFDADGSGDISMKESGQDASVFDRIDTNGDGVHSREEIARDLGSNPESMHQTRASMILESNDADGNGAISFKESGLSQERFDSIDTDGDGVHSQEEIISDLRFTFESQMVALEQELSEVPSASPRYAAAQYQRMQSLFAS